MEINNIQHMQSADRTTTTSMRMRTRMKRKWKWQKPRRTCVEEQAEGSKVGSLRGSRKKPVHKLSIIKMQNFPHAHNTDVQGTNTNTNMCTEIHWKKKGLKKQKQRHVENQKLSTLHSPESQKNTRQAAITSGETNGINDRWNARGERKGPFIQVCVCVWLCLFVLQTKVSNEFWFWSGIGN